MTLDWLSNIGQNDWTSRVQRIITVKKELDVQKIQLSTVAQRRWNVARDIILIQIQTHKLGQISQLWGYWSRKVVAIQLPARLENEFPDYRHEGYITRTSACPYLYLMQNIHVYLFIYSFLSYCIIFNFFNIFIKCSGKRWGDYKYCSIESSPKLEDKVPDRSEFPKSLQTTPHRY